MTDMQLTPQLVDAETQPGGHRGGAHFFIVIIIVVKSGRQRSSYPFIHDRSPLDREVTVLIAIIVF